MTPALNANCYLSRFRFVPVGRIFSQDEIREGLFQLAQTPPDSDGELRTARPSPLKRRWFDKFFCSPEFISQRQILTSPFAKNSAFPTSVGQISPSSLLRMPLEQRMQLGNAVARESWRTLLDSSSASQLIHVSCTSYASPSAGQRDLGAHPEESRRLFHLYHMGCSAALPAVHLAQALCLSQHAHSVDNPAVTRVLHTEFCSLHFRQEFTPEQLVIQSLFADGQIAYDVQTQPPKRGLRLISQVEKIIPQTEELMTWVCASPGFQMSLSKSIPQLLEQDLAQILPPEYRPEKSWVLAIHPGGPRILESVEKALGTDRSQSSHSHRVLHQWGNMSSATLPTIWMSLLEDPQIPAGTKVLSLAFSPGLSVLGSLMEVVES